MRAAGIAPIRLSASDDDEQETQMNPSGFSGPGEYQIVVRGHLDDEVSYWFEDLTMSTGYGRDEMPITKLAGRFADQAALHGVLATIRDLNLPLISVCPGGDETAAKSDPQGSA